jgi:hypothetical protein
VEKSFHYVRSGFEEHQIIRLNALKSNKATNHINFEAALKSLREMRKQEILVMRVMPGFCS